ncbi:cortexin-3 isoform X5 [Panthera tigris]|uniref:cortexin-3 isoform X5 n=1 Tax=Panthera tigris TaxID=9694 RepID=UPI001C6F78B2|nr:cortexin-3 isoform X5 [Panthera tigris]
MDLWGSDGLTTELGELPGQKVQSKARSWEGLHHSLIVTVASNPCLPPQKKLQGLSIFILEKYQDCQRSIGSEEKTRLGKYIKKRRTNLSGPHGMFP